MVNTEQEQTKKELLKVSKTILNAVGSLAQVVEKQIKNLESKETKTEKKEDKLNEIDGGSVDDFVKRETDINA